MPNITYCGHMNAPTDITTPPTIPSNIPLDSLSETFKCCENLKNPPTIPNTVTNMYRTFDHCYNLISAPTIPNSVINMVGTFDLCKNLRCVPNIPNSVTNLCFAFDSCYNLVSVPNIPDSAHNLEYTFVTCENLITAPSIGKNVTRMHGTFQNCYNLRGDIFVYSDKVDDCFDCFRAHGNTYSINLYCHKDTQTWNNFKDYLGGIDNRVLNIHLKEMQQPIIDWNTYHLRADQDIEYATPLPEGITNISSTFHSRKKLKEAPTIPNSVTNMAWCFAHCSNLTSAPVIPNSVTNLCGTFWGCRNLISVPDIPETVTDMYSAFGDCPKLTDIFVYSKNVKDVTSCFSGHNPEILLNLYCPKDSLTWNNFKEYLGGDCVNEDMGIYMYPIEPDINAEYLIDDDTESEFF